MFQRGLIRSGIMAAIVAAAIASVAHAGETENKELVVKAVTGLFIDHDAAVVDQYWGEDYIQHNPMFPNGRDVIKGFAANPPPGFKYEMGAVAADGDLVIVRGRYTGFAPKPMVAMDMFRVADGKIVEHWDILQEEVPAGKTASGNPMFEPGM